MVKKITLGIITITLLLAFNINAFSNEADTFFEKGKELYSKGKFHIALTFFEKSVEKNPLNASTYFYLGNIYNHREDYKKAIDAYLKGLDLCNNKNIFYFNLARTYQVSKDYKKAIATYRKLLANTDKIPEVYYYLGLANFGLRIKDETINNLENYLAKAPRSPQYDTIKKVIAYLKTNDEVWKKPTGPIGPVQYLMYPQGKFPQGQFPQGRQGFGSMDIYTQESDIQTADQGRKEGPEFDDIEK